MKFIMECMDSSGIVKGYIDITAKSWAEAKAQARACGKGRYRLRHWLPNEGFQYAWWAVYRYLNSDAEVHPNYGHYWEFHQPNCPICQDTTTAIVQ